MHGTRKPSLRQRSAALLLAILLGLVLNPRQAWASQGDTRQLIPMGTAVGIKLFSDGVIVVSTSDLNTSGTSPAKDCGLKEGDLILRINNEEIQSTEHLQSVLQETGTAPVTLTVRRGGTTMEKKTCAVECPDGVYRLGVWIRDSMAGIGTLTFYDPETGSYGALGHGITDVDTHVLMPLSAGSIMETTVRAVKKGQRGQPGELKGDFSFRRDLGIVSANTTAGIFGTVSDESFAGDARPIPVAKAGEVHVGEASILCTVSGDRTESYRVEIVRVSPNKQDMRNLLLRVTDQRLLDATGGIVQGMSGSPIIQNGKFVGAVTHVLVNDPTQGYGILMENMLKMAG